MAEIDKMGRKQYLYLSTLIIILSSSWSAGDVLLQAPHNHVSLYTIASHHPPPTVHSLAYTYPTPPSLKNETICEEEKSSFNDWSLEK